MDFTEALNVAMDSIERPVPLPRGTYRWKVNKVAVIGKRGKDKEWNTIDIPILPVEPGDDVDPDELDAFGKLEAGANRITFMMEDGDEGGMNRTLWQMRNFFENVLGMEVSEGTPVKQLLADCVNYEFYAEATHRPDEDNPEIIYVQVGKPRPLNTD